MLRPCPRARRARIGGGHNENRTIAQANLFDAHSRLKPFAKRRIPDAFAIRRLQGLNTYVNLALRQLVNQRRIPFELVPAEDTPNEETRRAMVLAEAKELGIVKDNDPSFDDADMLMASLDED